MKLELHDLPFDQPAHACLSGPSAKTLEVLLLDTASCLYVAVCDPAHHSVGRGGTTQLSEMH